MILYYAELPGGERVFVDPINGKLEIEENFKYVHSILKELGTDKEWISEFENHQDDFLSWAKERIDSFSGGSGECGCYLFNGSELHLIKENMTVEGDYRSCTLFNGKKSDKNVTGTGVLEEWDDEGKLVVRKIGNFKDGLLQGLGEKYDFGFDDVEFHFSKGEFSNDKLNGYGRFMAHIWQPLTYHEKRIYFISDWVKSCMDPETPFSEIITPLEGDELVFSSIRIGTFRNDELDGNGVTLWGCLRDDVFVSVGKFSEGLFTDGLDIYSGLHSNWRVIIRKGSFRFKKNSSNESCDGTYEKCVIYALWDYFRFSDFIPLINDEMSLREYMVNNRSFSPELYQKGNFTDGLLNGEGTEVTYRHSNEPYEETGVNKAYEFSVYTGNFVYGMKHGKGSFENKNGLKYCGEFFADRFHGEGKLIRHYQVMVNSDGSDKYIGCEEVQIGNFVCDLAHGNIHTARIYEDGDAEIYEGSYAIDRMEGTHNVKSYENVTAEECAPILDAENFDNFSLPDEKMTENSVIQYLHGEIVEE